MECKFGVRVIRDMGMMKTCIRFNNRVHHPRVSMHLFVIGVVLLGMPAAAGKGPVLRDAACMILGSFFVFMSLFRQNIAAARMKKNTEIEWNEELFYLFGQKGVQVIKDGNTVNIGGYKNIFRLWEDERNYYVGMNEDDLLILPKAGFEIGSAEEFRDFVLEKSNAGYSWTPADIVNICKWKIKKQKDGMH